MSSSSTHHHSRSHPPPSSATTQACAACKYQRRKCAPDCILAPYFPHDRQRQFLNAHKLFGVSNITKIIKNLDPFEKEEAMRTIIFQSDVRSLDPVGGCYRIIRDLQRQIEYSKAELDIVLHQLAICKQAAAVQRHEAVAFNGEMVLLDPDPLNGYGEPQQQPPPPQHQFLQPYEVEVEAEAFAGQFGSNNDDNNFRESLDGEVEVEVWGMQDSLSSSSLHIKQGGAGAGAPLNDFDDIKLHTDHHDHHQHHQHLKFHPHHHDLLKF